MEIIRNCAQNIESVELICDYYNEKTEKYSRTYSFSYTPTDPNMKDPAEFTKEVLESQEMIRESIMNNLQIQLR